MEQTYVNVEKEPKSRSWLFILDYVYYAAILAVVAGLAYYLYSFRDSIALFLPTFLQGAETTIFLSLSSMILATIFGFIGALGRLSRFAPFRWIAAIYVEVIRGTPILVQLFLWGFGIRGALETIGFDPYNYAYNFMTLIQSNSLLPSQFVFDAVFYGIVGLSFNYGAYLTEVFRTGIESVPIGQTEAGLSVGLTSGQILRRIVLPQAFRITIPPFANYFITLVQDSALLSTIGGAVELQTLISTAATASSSNANLQLFFYVFGAMLFLCICYPLAILAHYLETRMSIAY